jgi:hypothetical protein
MLNNIDNMELQNIVVDFYGKKTITMYNDKHYDVDVISEMERVRIKIELEYDIIIDKVIIQLTFDQSLSEPRILCINDGEITIITFEDIKINHPSLSVELNEIITLIEEQLSNIINN